MYATACAAPGHGVCAVQCVGSVVHCTGCEALHVSHVWCGASSCIWRPASTAHDHADWPALGVQGPTCCAAISSPSLDACEGGQTSGSLVCWSRYWYRRIGIFDVMICLLSTSCGIGVELRKVETCRLTW
jgi:hypothetical protein